MQIRLTKRRVEQAEATLEALKKILVEKAPKHPAILFVEAGVRLVRYSKRGSVDNPALYKALSIDPKIVEEYRKPSTEITMFRIE